jgi:hypothetical protein
MCRLNASEDRVLWEVVVSTVMNVLVLEGGEFLDQLSHCKLLKKDSAPWN